MQVVYVHIYGCESVQRYMLFHDLKAVTYKNSGNNTNFVKNLKSNLHQRACVSGRALSNFVRTKNKH